MRPGGPVPTSCNLAALAMDELAQNTRAHSSGFEHYVHEQKGKLDGREIQCFEVDDKSRILYR
jgi:hypothetical protein